MNKNFTSIQIFSLFLFLNLIFFTQINAQVLEGQIKIDSTWSSKIYLSYIPTFEDMYSMSADMIISEADVNPDGFYEFNLDYLPKENRLYRLHLVKKTDTKSSLIIGGKNENFLLLIAHKNSMIKIESHNISPPFKNTHFIEDSLNVDFQEITRLIQVKDSLASVSNAYKRKFLNDKLKNDLLKIADTSTNPLVSMYAIYKSDFEADFAKNKEFYETFSNKWARKDNIYFKNFNEKVSEKQNSNNYYSYILLGIICIVIGFLTGKYSNNKKDNFQDLSVQERKVFRMLKKGASNKEISEEFNIGISTVKSHVSSILSKMNAKSRKELMHSE